MTKSMTGYGSYALEKEKGRVLIEMKSVNHRFCDIQFRMPRQLLHMESILRQRIQENIERGKIDVFVTLEGVARSSKDAEVDWSLLHRMLDQAEEMEQLNIFDSTLRLQDFLLHPDIVTVQEGTELDQEWEQAVQEAVSKAAVNLYNMRVREGEALQADFLTRIETIQKNTYDIQEQAPDVVSAYRDRLQDRIRDFMNDSGYEAEEQRLLTEVAVFSEKANIDEELTRLLSHCDQFVHTLHEHGAKGRKLDFLVQEMNREANTIGSKANNAALSHLVVDIKSELEKIKEQVQNIE
ncbi:YicC family protein [Salibacterium salarium]|uniref:YicC family protein n=1 Tax=Salibacterium salarium TaxID=284579 RepID=A0A3R9QI98_9BACI|nr:YicC/YloC family endoribonuclease [Salibacterium salarium]RSL31283.1 YicC family protein [Salibacterium salarium]